MRQFFRGLGIGILLIILFGGIWLTGAISLLWHRSVLTMFPADPSLPQLGLARYRLDGGPVVVAGVKDNLSGLTFSHDHGTLFATINRPPAVIELSPLGEVLRRIEVRGIADLEGITHISGDRFILVDEAANRLDWVMIDATTQLLDVTAANFLQLEPSQFHNMGYEALSWDNVRQTLWVGQEMWPMRITSITGLEQAISGAGIGLSLTPWSPRGLSAGSFIDLSSMSVDDRSGNLLLLSDLTSAIAEFSAEGEPIGLLPLWKGYSGLDHDIPQAEGVAIGSDSSLYVISEPNLFYRFTAQDPPRD